MPPSSPLFLKDLQLYAVVSLNSVLSVAQESKKVLGEDASNPLDIASKYVYMCSLHIQCSLHQMMKLQVFHFCFSLEN